MAGNHHTKALLLKYASGLRLSVLTGGADPEDLLPLLNGVWWQASRIEKLGFWGCLPHSPPSDASLLPGQVHACNMGAVESAGLSLSITPPQP